MRTSTVCESGAHSRSGIGQDMDHHRDKERRVEVTTDEFRALFEAVSNWDRWGPDDERGALNYLTADRILAAVRLVRTGEPLTLSLPLNTQLGIDNPVPADHYMTMLGDQDVGSGTLRFAKDYIGADYHNASHSHIDALCHVSVSYTHLRAHETDSYLVCRLLLDKKKTTS